MSSLRYTEVHQVKVDQLRLLMDLLGEMSQCGGTVAKMVTDTKVVLVYYL